MKMDLYKLLAWGAFALFLLLLAGLGSLGDLLGKKRGSPRKPASEIPEPKFKEIEWPGKP